METVLNDIKAQIRSAAHGGDKLAIHGAGSKAFYGEPLLGQPLDVCEYQGIVAYEPSELYLTARCGTPLQDIEHVLAEKNQMLAFEAPHFAGTTVGGCVATALAGPRRAYAGAVRDYVLGLKLIDGRGDELTFGGQVMKNVAGFDISRFVVGSLGCLGVVSEVSFKLAPRPACETTLRLELGQAAAIDKLNRLAGQPLPLSASAWLEGQLWLRLSGAEPAVVAARQLLGGEALPGAAIWGALREQTLGLFASPRLWRIAVPPATPPQALPEVQQQWQALELAMLRLKALNEINADLADERMQFAGAVIDKLRSSMQGVDGYGRHGTLSASGGGSRRLGSA